MKYLIFYIPIIYWILINFANFFDAAGDAEGKKSKWILSKTFQMLTLISICAMIPLARYLPAELTTGLHWLYLVLMYIFVRVGIFNAVWSLFRFKWTKSYLYLFKKKDDSYRIKIRYWVGYWWYLGETPLYDRMLNWIITTVGCPQKFFLSLLYIISWVVSIGILIQGFYVIPE